MTDQPKLSPAEQAIIHFKNMSDDLIAVTTGQSVKDSMATTTNHHVSVLKQLLAGAIAMKQENDQLKAPAIAPASEMAEDAAIKESYA